VEGQSSYKSVEEFMEGEERAGQAFDSQARAQYTAYRYWVMRQSALTPWSWLMEYDKRLRQKITTDPENFSFQPAVFSQDWNQFVQLKHNEYDPVHNWRIPGATPRGREGGRQICNDFQKVSGCSRFRCQFQHKCKICGRTSHGAATCFDRPGGKGGKNGKNGKGGRTGGPKGGNPKGGGGRT
jgi:uncharacterized membrane protein YgcG